MQSIIIALLVILIVLVGALFIIFLKKKVNTKIEGVQKIDLELLKKDIDKESSNKTGELKDALINSEKQLTALLNEKFNKTSENLNTSDKQVKDFILNQTNSTRDKLEKSVEQLQEWLKKVNDHTLPISEMKEKVNKLNILLSQNNKAGKAGEYFLTRVFDNISSDSKFRNLLFLEQYTMIKKSENGKQLKVDLFIKGNGSNLVNIPIDAKFPFNAYEKLVNINPDTEDFKKIQNEFVRDCTNRKNEVKKYISIEDKTVYAIMFIPSESIFSYICGHTNLVDDAFKDKVIIAGPSTLMSIILSIENYMSLFNNISKYDKKVDILNKVIKYIDNYDEAMAKLFKSIEQLSESYSNVSKKEKTLKKEYERLINANELE
ncbi:DNA recombination protein RmuC [Spiroplasma helicoides]|uniref:DNA recombination protein RmuC n=1 Tax=Spiroplasma helicoides TaxID=216938 RepID=A0A1B3SLX0_9MOLU|nr:DNA recombination protein RmuC [Spiroplasma helicoides]AOG60936.1 DNA recombination protein RmuC [Spiroplasma helicoides]